MFIIERYLKEDRDFSKQDSVKALVFRGDYILLLRRQQGQPGEGQWDLPGGHIEKGEDKVKALKRETWEEAGLKIENEKSDSNFTLEIPEDGVESTMYIYTADAKDIDVELKPADWEGSDGKPEHNEYAWFQYKHELNNLPMLPQLKEIVLKHLK